MGNNAKEYYSLEDLFEKNKLIKKEEIDTIKNFKNIYNILRRYDFLPVKYNEVITNSEVRYEFLMDSIRIACENQKIDPYTRDIIFQMYEEIYRYLYDDSELEEIEIPEEMINGIFDRNIIPNEMQIDFVMKLLKENKRIFDEEFRGKYFSQTIEEGLHTGITKELKIEEDNLSHLLGLTNEGSLYAFYRKTVLNQKINRMFNLLGVSGFEDPKFSMEEFNLMFKEEFGLDYSSLNCKKIINWRYNAEDDYLTKRGLSVSSEERMILDSYCNYASKSDTINFYCDRNNVMLFIKENGEVGKFIFDYVRNDIIIKSKTKNNYNAFKKFYGDDLELLLDTSIDNDDERIISLINKYIFGGKYKLEEDKTFKKCFIDKFDYAYPLVNYYELLSKNVSFYNFSLFKNLNSIIVDYDPKGKKIRSDVFLVSYSKNKRLNNDHNVMKLINAKNDLYDMASRGEVDDSGLNKDYLMDLKSLLNFPIRDRYYLRYRMLSEEETRQDDGIIIDNTNHVYNFALIGFKTEKDEIKVLEDYEISNRKRFKHFLKCETNLSSNYLQYVMDFTRNGIEYPLDILEERGRMPYNRKTKVLKIVKPIDKIDKYMFLFERYKYDVTCGSYSSLEEMKDIRRKVLYMIDVYDRMTNINNFIMYDMLENRNRNIDRDKLFDYRRRIERDSIKSEQIKFKFNKYTEYMDDTIKYCESLVKIKR